MDIIIIAVLWLVCSFAFGFLIGSFIRRMDDRIDRIFEEELHKREQRKFNKYVNQECHRLFNGITHH